MDFSNTYVDEHGCRIHSVSECLLHCDERIDDLPPSPVDVAAFLDESESDSNLQFYRGYCPSDPDYSVSDIYSD